MKKHLSFLIVTVLICSMLTFTASADNITQVTGNNNVIVFTDVGNSYSWANDAITDFSKKGIVQGGGDGKFNPDESVTREQFAKMLVLTYNAQLPAIKESSFNDVPVDRWSAPYIEVCKDFLTGYNNPFGGKPLFRPEDAATREDISVALVKILGLTTVDLKDPNYTNNTFTDAADISPGLNTYVSLAAEKGLIKGYSDKTFRPQKPVTRAEAVVLLYRATKQAVTAISNDGATPKPTQSPTAVSTPASTPMEFDRYYEPPAHSDPQMPVITLSAGLNKDWKITNSFDVPVYVLEDTIDSTVSDPTIAGSVFDKNDSENNVKCNGYDVNALHNDFNLLCKLNIGSNIFVFTATNKNGKTAIKQITITYQGISPVTYPILTDGSFQSTGNPVTTPTVSMPTLPPAVTPTPALEEAETTDAPDVTPDPLAPVIIVTQCPTDSDIQGALIEGSIEDKNDHNVKVTINGYNISGSNSYWGESFTLNIGTNILVIKATNKFGRTSTVKRKITFGGTTPVTYPHPLQIPKN